MSNEKSYSLHSDPMTILAVLIGLVLAYYVFQLLRLVKNLLGPSGLLGFLGGKGKESVAIVSGALDSAAENYGIFTSDGANNPTLLWNQARLAYAKQHNVPQGTPSNPPAGFPSLETWLYSHPVEAF